MYENNIVDTEHHKGFEINIYADDDPESPREWENLGTMWCKHSRYTLGDVHGEVYHASRTTREDFLEHIYDNHAEKYIEWDGEDHDVMFARIQRWVDKNVIQQPLYLYDHSGISISTTGFHCPWDSGQVGIIYATKHQIRENWNCKRVTKKILAQVESSFNGEVSTYDDYLTGAVYRYTVSHPSIEHLDMGCGGFYGYDHEDSGLMPEARGDIDHHLEWVSKQRQQAVKVAIKNSIPFEYRPQFISQRTGVQQ